MIEISDRQWARLWDKVERAGSEECWIWKGARSSGTPQMFVSVPGTSGTSLSVRRIIWEQTRGEDVPAGHVVTTSCGDQICVNPNHLVRMSRREFALRNGSPTATNSKREVCKNGHPFTEENTYLRRDGRGRQCRACAREQVGRHRKRKRHDDTES